VALDDLFELGDLLLSWRLYVGIAITCGVCWLLLQAIPNETIGWAVCIPFGIVGFILSFRWQVRADNGK
jgi:hypothetical protein